MRLKPEARNLLATALAAFRAEVLPAVPAEKRYAALMIANALAMVEREFSATDAPVSVTLYHDASLAAEEVEPLLTGDIEAGAFDALGPRRDAAFSAVKAINAARLAITNPKLLPAK
jgi:Domain of unknown function (DUF6285)